MQIENLRQWEKVEFVIRRHWIVFFRIWFYAITGVIIWVLLLGILGTYVWVLFLMNIFWMFFALFLYIDWLNNELDLLVITNNRIICVEQKSFLNRAVWECNLGQVQEVTSEIQWFFSNILNYGTIIIKTAGSTTNLDMTYAPDPLNNCRKILNVVDHYRDSHSFSNEQARAEPIST